MARLRGVPPGRAARVHLRRRLAVAVGAERLLESKLRILGAEERRLQLLHERTGAQWEASVRSAELWLARGAVLGGESALRMSLPAAPATVEVTWTTTMGVAHPAHARVQAGPARRDLPGPATAALSAAADSYAAALAAGADHAVSGAALLAVRREITSTRLRSRALRERWVPLLRGALARATFELDEQERSEAVQLRWASGHRSGGRPATRSSDHPPGGHG